jgi:hypothetical protein
MSKGQYAKDDIQVVATLTANPANITHGIDMPQIANHSQHLDM